MTPAISKPPNRSGDQLLRTCGGRQFFLNHLSFLDCASWAFLDPNLPTHADSSFNPDKGQSSQETSL